MTQDEVLADRVHAAVMDLNAASLLAEKSGLEVSVTVDLILSSTKPLMGGSVPTYLVKAKVSRPPEQERGHEINRPHGEKSLD